MAVTGSPPMANDSNTDSGNSSSGDLHADAPTAWPAAPWGPLVGRLPLHSAAGVGVPACSRGEDQLAEHLDSTLLSGRPRKF